MRQTIVGQIACFVRIFGILFEKYVPLLDVNRSYLIK